MQAVKRGRFPALTSRKWETSPPNPASSVFVIIEVGLSKSRVKREEISKIIREILDKKEVKV